MTDLRQLPAVHALLAEPPLAAAAATYGHDLVADAAREALDAARHGMQAGATAPGLGELADAAMARLAGWTASRPQRVINATGVILHTNLGRSPVSAAAARAMAEVSAGYSDLEYDLAAGERGSRHGLLRDAVTRLTGAEDALVVNNNAGATLLVLSALARDRGVIVSRGQLVEIGGSYRIPDVMAAGGARLVEVGTTNRTYLADYRAAVDDDTALLLRVHTSNYRVVGFTHEVPLAELVGLGVELGLPVVDDLGSGSLLDTGRFGLAREPLVQESVAAGATLVTFSGDKLLGGPQAGVIVGQREAVARLRRHPLARALRPGKDVLAGLHATLLHYLLGEAETTVPVWQMIARGARGAGPSGGRLAGAAGPARRGRRPRPRRVHGGRWFLARRDAAHHAAGVAGRASGRPGGRPARRRAAAGGPHRRRARGAGPADGAAGRGRGAVGGGGGGMERSWDDMRARHSVLAIATTLALLGAMDTSHLAAAPAPAAGPATRVLRSDEGGTVITWRAPEPVLRTVDHAGTPFVRVEAPGLDSPLLGGKLDLPTAAVLLGIPPAGTPRLQVDVVQADHRVLTAPLARVPFVGPGGLADPTAPGEIVAEGATPADASAVAAISHVGWVRGQRVARIEIAPYRYDPDGCNLTIYSTLRLTLNMSSAPAAPRAVASAPATTDPAFAGVLAGALVNAAAAAAWRLERGPPAADAADGPLAPNAVDSPPPPSERGPVWNLTVPTSGLYRVTGAELAAQGLRLAEVDPARLQLYRGGRPVAIWVEGAVDGRLGEADSLVFYGRPERSRYAADGVYQLAVVDGTGLRMTERGASPDSGAAGASFTSTVRLEQDLLYRSDLPRSPLRQPDLPGVDRWYWSQLNAPGAMSAPLQLPAVAGGSWTGQLRLAAVGKSSLGSATPDHELAVQVDGVAVGIVRWDGNGEVIAPTLPVPSYLLADGEVEVTVTATGGTTAEYDQSLLDWIEVDYQRRFVSEADRLAFAAAADGAPDVLVSGFGAPGIVVLDVTDAANPVRMAGTQVRSDAGSYSVRFRAEGRGRRYEAVADSGYLEPAAITARAGTDLWSPSTGADYVVVAPADFHAAMAPLLAHRAATGLRTALVDLGAVYDAFGGGMASAEAIRAFVAHAYQHWPAPPPSHLLLVGDGTYDPTNRLGTGSPTLLPPFLKVADPWLGEVAAENAFVTVVGDDPFPDLFLGRLPVQAPDEAIAVVNKIIDYETAPPEGPWRSRLLFAADDPDNAGDFHAMSDAVIAGHVPDGFTADRVYLGSSQHPGVDTARRAVLDKLNEGTLLAHYIGHGLITGWGQEQILRRADMPQLSNGRRLPVLLDMTCMTGFFTDPERSSISEEAVRVPNGGAIAAFSPTGFGIATGHDVLDRTFLDLLLDHNVTHLGQLAVTGKLRLGTTTTAYDDLLDTFAILGDPALKVALPNAAPPSGTPPATAVPVRPSPGVSATITAPASVTVVVPTSPPTVTPRPPADRVWLPLAVVRRR